MIAERHGRKPTKRLITLYGFREQGNESFRYIGQTNNLRRRLYEHRRRGRPEVYWWLKAVGGRLEIVVFAEVKWHQAKRLEMDLLFYHRATLLNGHLPEADS